MPTVIDSLVLELGIDADKFTRVQRQLVENLDKTKDSVKKQGQQVEKSAKDAGEFVEKLGRQFLGLFAVVTGGRGLKDFTEWVTRSDAALGRMADNIGVSRKALYDWQHVSVQMGGSAEDATVSLEAFNHAVQQMKTGRVTREYQQLQEALSRAGYSKSAFDVLMSQPADKALLDLAEAMGKLSEKDRQLAADQLKMIGLSESMVNAMLAGKPAVQAMIAEIEKHGEVTKQDTDASNALIKAWDNMQASATGLGRSLRTELTPALLEALKGFTDLFDAIRNRDLTELKKDIRTPEEIGKEFPSIEEVLKARELHKSRRRLLGGVGALGGDDRIGLGDLVSKSFWQGIKSIENQSYLLLESFKRIFRPILDWLEQHFGWSHLFGIGGAAAAAGGGAYGGVGGAPLAPGAATELPGQRMPATPSYSGRPDARGQARRRLQQRSGPPIPANTNEAMRIMRDQLIKEGVPEQNAASAAAILVGNAIHESGLNPRAVHDSGTGYGIYGARLSRRDKMLSWLKEHGYSNDSLEGQARYMAHEAMTTPGYGRTRQALIGATPGSIASGAYTAERNFESPVPGSTQSRVNAALSAYKQFTGRIPDAGASQDGLHTSGNLTMGGETFRYGSGGHQGLPHIPYGTYPITRGTIGAWGQAHGAIGINNNSIWDQSLGRMRSGIEFHSGSNDSLLSAGCIAILSGQWPRFKQRLNEVMKEHGGRAFLHIGPHGASITPERSEHGAAAVHAARQRILNRAHPIHGSLRDFMNMGGSLKGMEDTERERWMARTDPKKWDWSLRVREIWNKAILSRPHINRHLSYPGFHHHQLAMHHHNVTTNHANTDTKIGEIHIHTAATDAHGIARDIKPALQRTGMAMQANYSLA